MFKCIDDLSFYRDENEQNFYDIEHNDTNDELNNMILVYNRYSDRLLNHEIQNTEIDALSRVICQYLESIIDDYRDDLHDYIKELVDYTLYIDTYDFKYISDMYNYSRRLRQLLDTSIPNKVYDNFIQNKVLSNEVLRSIIHDVLHTHEYEPSIIVQTYREMFLSQFTYDNISNETWLSNYLRDHVRNDNNVKMLLEMVIGLNERKVSRYGY